MNPIPDNPLRTPDFYLAKDRKGYESKCINVLEG